MNDIKGTPQTPKGDHKRECQKRKKSPEKAIHFFPPQNPKESAQQDQPNRLLGTTKRMTHH